jgi:hypothetical protein
LFALSELHTREGLKEQPPQRRDIDARRIDEGVLPTSDPADFALVVDREIELFGEVVVDAIAASAGVDKRSHPFPGQVGNAARSGA